MVNLLPIRPIDTSWMERCNRPEPPKQSNRRMVPLPSAKPPEPITERFCQRCAVKLPTTAWRKYCNPCAKMVKNQQTREAIAKERAAIAKTPCRGCGGPKPLGPGVRFCKACGVKPKDYYRKRYWAKQGFDAPPPRGYVRRSQPLPAPVPMKRTGSTVSRMIPERLPYQR